MLQYLNNSDHVEILEIYQMNLLLKYVNYEFKT
jgi:hypothetical protein